MGLDADSFFPSAIEKKVCAFCEKFLNQAGTIVGPSATTRNISQQENEISNSRWSASHAACRYLWRKIVAALTVNKRRRDLLFKKGQNVGYVRGIRRRNAMHKVR